MRLTLHRLAKALPSEPVTLPQLARRIGIRADHSGIESLRRVVKRLAEYEIVVLAYRTEDRRRRLTVRHALDAETREVFDIEGEAWAVAAESSPSHRRLTLEDFLVALRAVVREYLEVRERNCDECGQSFAPRRHDARYCSPACRQAAYRARARYGTGTYDFVHGRSRQRRPYRRQQVVTGRVLPPSGRLAGSRES